MYKDEYTQSIKNKKTYFESQARTLISWDRPFTTIQNGNEWFTDGYLNACYNVIDRNCSLNPYKIAVIYETNEGETVKYTYLQCQQEIMKIANYLKYRVGDERVCVAVYMPNSDQLLFTILACARLGLPHNVIFGGFTAESISLRIKDSNAKIVFTVDKAKREKKIIDFYANVINACHLLKKENYDLDCLVVYDKNEISLESIVEIVLWNDVLKGEIYDRDELRLGTPKRVALSKDKESVTLELKREYKTEEEMHIEKEMIVKPRVKLDLDAFVPCVSVKAENELFYLYTSGSTGKPKGLVHTTGGYLTYAALTTLKVFNVSKDDIFCSTADIGWITGHTYSVYGPLALGCTIVLIGGIPTFPSSSRSFEIIEKHKITHFYTAPTVIRMLQKNLGIVEAGFKTDNQSDSTNATNVESVLQLLPDDLLDTQYDMSFDEMQKYEPSSFYRPNDNFYAMGHDLSSLQILGTVGEPINKEAYVWYKKTFGPYLPVIDTYWQTEAGGIMISAIPYQTYPVPECACVPFYGMEPMIMKEGREIGTIVFEGTWPGIARTILNDHERYENAYFSKYKNCYYTGDEGYMDNGYFFIRGREDDVLNVAGHRMSTAEIESACCSNEMVVETAAVGVKDTITGQAIVLFCVKKSGKDEVVCEYVKQTLREKIGPVVKIKRVYIVSEVPKTRTGKIMRRVLRDIIEERELGDLSTCNNVDVIEMIKEKVFGSVDEKTEQGSFVNV